jgi:hypothetical protein
MRHVTEIGFQHARIEGMREASSMSIAKPAARQCVAGTHNAGTVLGSGDWQPTYAALSCANQSALLRQGGTADNRIALLMAHDAPVIDGVPAILKAARIVVTLNPTHPAALQHALIAHSAPDVPLTDTTNADIATEVADGACSMAMARGRQNRGHEGVRAIGCNV